MPKIDPITASKAQESILQLNACLGPVVALKLNPEVSQKQHVFFWKNPLFFEQFLCTITIPSMFPHCVGGKLSFPISGAEGE